MAHTAQGEAPLQLDLDDVMAYDAALATIYEKAEAGEGNLTERVLRPVYEAVLATTGVETGAGGEGLFSPQDHIRVACLVTGVMERLQSEGELEAEDVIELDAVNGVNWYVTRYTDGAGNGYVIDPSCDYVGPLEDAPVRYEGLAKLSGIPPVEAWAGVPAEAELVHHVASDEAAHSA